MCVTLFQAAQEARADITPAIIKTSFERTGIVPWNAELILERAELNVGVTSEEPICTLEHYDGLVAFVRDIIQDCLALEGYESVDVDPVKGQVCHYEVDVSDTP